MHEITTGQECEVQKLLHCKAVCSLTFSMLWLSILVLGLAPLIAAKPLTSNRWNDVAVKHAWVETPRGWEFHSAPPADHLLEMRIGLKQNKLDELITSLYEVSDPAHERYTSSTWIDFAHIITSPQIWPALVEGAG